VAESEQAGGRLPHCLCRHLGVRIGSVAAREEALLAEPALPAANGERDDDAIADFEVFDFGTQFDHLAHVLVTENIAALHGGLITVEEMKV
jgi:hypothetical protein